MADKKTYLFDNPRNVKILLYGLYICCGVLLLLDFVIHRHTEHRWEELLGFYSIYGFIGCTAIVIGSKWLRGLVERAEDYYTKDELTMDEEEFHVDD
jgi:hypothetical protein